MYKLKIWNSYVENFKKYWWYIFLKSGNLNSRLSSHKMHFLKLTFNKTALHCNSRLLYTPVDFLDSFFQSLLSSIKNTAFSAPLTSFINYLHNLHQVFSWVDMQFLRTQHMPSLLLLNVRAGLWTPTFVVYMPRGFQISLFSFWACPWRLFRSLLLQYVCK